MKVKSVTYVGSFGYKQALPRPLGPEFVFIGRSNVGKSSLINTLVGRKNVARTSNTPGKTRTANFYTINDAFCFVDVPGYGYAQVSKSERAQSQKLIATYIATRKALAGVIQLLDVRHAPSAADRDTAEILSESGKALCLVFNKIDKIKRPVVDREIASHLQGLSVDGATVVVPFSSETGAGKRELWAWIQDRL